MESVWIANLVTGTVVIMVIGWLFSRFVKNYDSKIDEIKIMATTNAKRIEEIEEQSLNKIDSLKDQLANSERRLSEEIKLVVADKNNYRLTQTTQMTRVETKQELIIGTLKEIKEHVFKNRS